MARVGSTDLEEWVHVDVVGCGVSSLPSVLLE